MDKRQISIQIFLAGVESVKPKNLISRYVSLDQNNLQIEKFMFNLSELKNIYVIGAGKASSMMAFALESILGNRITKGHIITKYNHSVPLQYIESSEAGHPVPDESGIRGTEQILEIVRQAEKDDLVICLISGGGSALLTDVPEGCTLEDVKDVNSVLLKSGANINQMNCIRKHLSSVKGGLLSKAAFPARVISLILSDVIGDPLDVIASGPTAPDPTTFGEALSIIKYFQIENEIPKQIYQVLQEGFENKRQDTLKEFDEILFNTTNLIIGTNKLALATAKEKAESFGYESQIITNTLEGDVIDVAHYIVNIAQKIKADKNDRKICLLFSGEPTIKVMGNGLGGRNQHLALIVSKLLINMPDVTFLSAGTDGTDGPTDAAGAVVDSLTYWKASNLHLDVEKYISNHDSYNFFKQEGGFVITGPTHTNVMDLMIVLIN